jgi:hypothetical protein
MNRVFASSLVGVREGVFFGGCLVGAEADELLAAALESEPVTVVEIEITVPDLRPSLQQAVVPLRVRSVESICDWLNRTLHA